MEERFTAHELRTWRRQVLIRDAELTKVGPTTLRQSHCVMCCIGMPVGELQAHHIWPKGRFPERALMVTNGVTLCPRCHIDVVHRRNPATDVGKPTIHANWYRFVALFEHHALSPRFFIHTNQAQKKLKALVDRRQAANM